MNESTQNIYSHIPESTQVTQYSDSHDRRPSSELYQCKCRASRVAETVQCANRVVSLESSSQRGGKMQFSFKGTPLWTIYHFVEVRGKSISSYSFQYFFKIPFPEYSQSLGLRFVFSFF